MNEIVAADHQGSPRCQEVVGGLGASGLHLRSSLRLGAAGWSMTLITGNRMLISQPQLS